MARPRRHSAALVITVHVDPSSVPAWYARIVGYRHPESRARTVTLVTTADDACTAVRVWLESVLTVVEDRPDDA